MIHGFLDMPILLFGHSLGAYASTAVLQYEHNIAAVVSASGFDDSKEQWEYSVKRYTGLLGTVLKPYSGILMSLKFGEMAHFSAIDGINSTNIPVLIISGTTDEFYHISQYVLPNIDIEIIL
ncbi:MAG: dipeptidyl aminopeptidase/acylaminoacyl-peptidase-like protein [Herbinix sp.]|jgi:pimeloyl-ACP methyl ester carboxylesterase|nr:dipeptidyl aminopeptidase/acylaminoacyl-peptidase-like protein [Herbinix sp.]